MSYRPADFSGLMQDYTRMYSLSMNKAQRDRDWAREDAGYAVAALDNLETIYFDELETYKSSVLDPNSADGLSDEQISDFNERFAQKYPALQREAGKIFDKYGSPKWAASGETDPDSPVSIIPNMLRKGAEFLLVGKNKDGETVPKTVNGTSQPEDPLVSMSMLDLIRNTRYSIATEYGLNPFSKAQVQARGQGIQELAKQGRDTVSEGLTTDTASTGPTLGQAANGGASSGDATTVNVNVESNPVDASSDAAKTSDSIRAQQAQMAGMYAPVGGMMDREGNVVLPEGNSTTPREQAAAALGSYYNPLSVQDQVMGTGPYENPVARPGQTANLGTLPANPNAGPPQIDKLSQQAQRRVGFEYDPQFATPPANPEAPDRRELGQLRNQEQELERRGGDPDLGAPTSAELNQRLPQGVAELPVEKREPLQATYVPTATQGAVTPEGQAQEEAVKAAVAASPDQSPEGQAAAAQEATDGTNADASIAEAGTRVARAGGDRRITVESAQAILAAHGLEGAIKSFDKYLADSTDDFFTRGKVDPYTGTAPSKGSTAQRIVFTAMAQEAGFFSKNATDLANMRTFIQTGRMPDEIKQHFENQKNMSAAYKSYVEAEYKRATAPLEKRKLEQELETTDLANIEKNIDLDKKEFDNELKRRETKDKYTKGTWAYRKEAAEVRKLELANEKQEQELRNAKTGATASANARKAVEDQIDNFAARTQQLIFDNIARGVPSGAGYLEDIFDLLRGDEEDQAKATAEWSSLHAGAKNLLANPANQPALLRAYLDVYGNSPLVQRVLTDPVTGKRKSMQDLNAADLDELAASGGLRLEEAYQASLIAEIARRDAKENRSGFLNTIASFFKGSTPMTSRDFLKAVHLGTLYKTDENAAKKTFADDYGFFGDPEKFVNEITSLVSNSGMGSGPELVNYMAALGKQFYIQDEMAKRRSAGG